MKSTVVVENKEDVQISNENFIRTHTDVNFRDMYKCLKRLGAGSFGEVWECEHKVTKVHWAVKILWRDLLRSGNEFETIFKEVDFMKKLNHPNIVKIYEMYQDEKRFYIVEELCEGGELFDEIDNMATEGKHFKEK